MTTITATRKSLRQRRETIIDSLGGNEAAIMAKVHSEAPLSLEEWAAKEELEEIDYLLSND